MGDAGCKVGGLRGAGGHVPQGGGWLQAASCSLCPPQPRAWGSAWSTGNRAEARSFPNSSRSSQKPSDIFLTFLSRSQMALLAGKPPLLRYRLVRCVYFCISKFCKSVLCVSSAGCCETPFYAVARLCPHLCGGTGRSHSSAQTLCWGSGP